MIAYHGTTIENSIKIADEGIKVKFDYVYLTDSLESALRWCAFKLRAQGIDKMAVIEVEVNENELEEGCDHSPMMIKIFGVGKSLVSVNDIPKNQIREIHYYQI
jgi:hypothetical protein